MLLKLKCNVLVLPKRQLEVDRVSSQFSVFLDESAMFVCMVHEPCKFRGRKAGPECRREYVYGVGAAVFESSVDAEGFRASLEIVRTRIRARNGVSTGKRMASFTTGGWHATQDLPEFADPLIQEIDTDGAFKGHVRYVESSVEAADIENLYRNLFMALLRSLFKRYSGRDIALIFEESGNTLADLRSLIKAAGAPTGASVRIEEKGDHLLALADYLLFATLKYVGRTKQLCDSTTCAQDHCPPIAAELWFDRDGAPLAKGHVPPDDRWHKMYYAFVRNMSSAVEVSFRPEPPRSDEK